MDAIVFEQVTKQFPNAPRPAVDHVSFQVDAGNLVVLLGPSGSGKTTLLKMINRLYEPTGGRILVEGTEVHDLPATELRRRIGYVIQQVGLFPHMTIEQNIAVVPQLVGWDKRRIDGRIEELLNLVSLPATYRKRYPRQLSGGEQQRVGLARALAADPDIMLMDEPFGAIDAITRARLQSELLDIQHKLHKTIMFVTHDVEEALRLADKIAILQTGQLVQYDTPLQIVTQPCDAFVRELVGAGNALRRLSLIAVESLLAARGDQARRALPVTSAVSDLETVGPDDDLRDALSRLVGSGADSLAVVGQDGRLLGQITFADIRGVMANGDHQGEGL
jgi:osmoprotectant transport system ATP-binding protein